MAAASACMPTAAGFDAYGVVAMGPLSFSFDTNVVVVVHVAMALFVVPFPVVLSAWMTLETS